MSSSTTTIDRSGKQSASNGQWCETPILWKNVFLMGAVHVVFVWVCVATVLGSISVRTVTLFWLYAFVSAFGILAGAHRLWSHRAYKARWPLRVLLMCMHTASLQNDLYDWCRNHRSHHRFSETNADPHNSRRGFFFSHMGWLLCRKHPDVKRYGARINMDDILADPVVGFQVRHYSALVVLLWLVLPVSVALCSGETLVTALLVNCWRYVVSLHNTWLVNSLAHLHGSRPYNRNIEPRQNKLVSYFSLGEGYHNYHHTFPWDYSASELGWRHNYNLTTAFIDCFAWCGLAYDRKVPTWPMVLRRMEKSGEPMDTDQLSTCFRRSKRTWSVVADTLAGLVTLTIPVWLLALTRVIYLLRTNFA